MTIEALSVLVIFVFTYFMLIAGKIRGSIIAFTMGLLVFVVKIVEKFEPEDIGKIIDFDTIGLLFGMMIIVGIMKSTGFFQFIAVHVVKLSHANFRTIFFRFSMVVALFSAFLDNVTTILLFSPLVFFITDTIGVDPSLFIFTLMFSANIGGAATLIGDPPNLLVGSASGKSFLDFIIVMAPVAISNMVILLFMSRIFNPNYFSKIRKDELKKLTELDPKKAITDKKLFLESTIVFSMVIFGFILHEVFDYKMALISIFGAAVLLLISGKTFEEVAKEVEWDTLFFFMGLFMLAHAMEEVGLIEKFTNFFLSLSNDPIILALSMIWIGGFLSAFIGAVPTVTVMIPMVKKMVSMGLPDYLWWALAMGASYGGNATITGTAANMVGVGLLESHRRKRISYVGFMKYGFPVMIFSLTTASFFILLLSEFSK